MNDEDRAVFETAFLPVAKKEIDKKVIAIHFLLTKIKAKIDAIRIKSDAEDPATRVSGLDVEVNKLIGSEAAETDNMLKLLKTIVATGKSISPKVGVDDIAAMVAAT